MDNTYSIQTTDVSTSGLINGVFLEDPMATICGYLEPCDVRCLTMTCKALYLHLSAGYQTAFETRSYSFDDGREHHDFHWEDDAHVENRHLSGRDVSWLLRDGSLAHCRGIKIGASGDCRPPNIPWVSFPPFQLKALKHAELVYVSPALLNDLMDAAPQLYSLNLYNCNSGYQDLVTKVNWNRSSSLKLLKLDLGLKDFTEPLPDDFINRLRDAGYKEEIGIKLPYRIRDLSCAEVIEWFHQMMQSKNHDVLAHIKDIDALPKDASSELVNLIGLYCSNLECFTCAPEGMPMSYKDLKCLNCFAPVDWSLFKNIRRIYFIGIVTDQLLDSLDRKLDVKKVFIGILEQSFVSLERLKLLQEAHAAWYFYTPGIKDISEWPEWQPPVHDEPAQEDVVASSLVVPDEPTQEDAVASSLVVSDNRTETWAEYFASWEEYFNHLGILQSDQILFPSMMSARVNDGALVPAQTRTYYTYAAGALAVAGWAVMAFLRGR